MSVDIETLKLLYFQNDEPCPYKLKCGYEVMLYPVKVKDWSIFERSLVLFQIDKNKINDIEVIKMSELDFVIKLCEQNEDYSLCLANILLYSMHEQNVALSTLNNKNVIAFCDENDNTKGYITHNEFNDIKKIILYQNIYDYKDMYVDPDVQQLYDDYYKIKNKNSKTPTLEEQKTYVLSKCSFTMKEINEMSYRMFSQIYKHAIGDIIYIGRKIIQGSYKYQVDDFQHPLYEKEKDRFAEIFEDTSVLSNKGISGAEQLNSLNLSQSLNK